MKRHTISCLLFAFTAALPLHAEDADLAKKLSNPVSDLISAPFQGNLDFGIGPGGGTKFTLNIQPVIPISLNEEWNLISRTILPVIDQEGISYGGVDDEFGLPGAARQRGGVGPALRRDLPVPEGMRNPGC